MSKAIIRTKQIIGQQRGASITAQGTGACSNKGNTNTLEDYANINPSTNRGELSKYLIIIDSSSSMDDVVGTSQKWDHLLHALNIHFSGSDAKCISFSSHSMAELTNINNPKRFHSGTSYAYALSFAKQYVIDFGIEKIILIGDGEDYNEEGILAEASAIGIPIDTIFIGPDGSDGDLLLRKIALASTGKHVNVETASEKEIAQLAPVIKGMIGDGKKTINL